MTTCEQQKLNNAYSDSIVDLAKQIEQGQRFDTNAIISRKKYLIAKRYKNIINYLATDIHCPTKTRDAVIEKLMLNYKS